MSDFRYNKHHKGTGHGSLIGNWQEERELRDFTGVGRTIMREHIPKKHLDFENPITSPKTFDNTVQRIYGEANQQPFDTHNTMYGVDKNAADAIPRVGKKTATRESEILAQVALEMKELQAQEEQRLQQRYFDTTTGTTHYAQDMQSNVVGRKVMRTQDGKLVPMGDRDNQLIVETGMWRRTQLSTDEELRARVPAGDYTQQRPVTIYTEALERKNTYMSAACGPNPFARTSGMTQPVNQTKSVPHDAGVIDFDKEKTIVKSVRGMGRDLQAGENPYMKKYVQLSNFEELQAKVIAFCKQRSANGLRGLRIMFRAMDRNKSGSLDPVEFKYAMRDYGLGLSEVEVQQILKYFDTNKDGKLSFDEFLRAIRGDLNERRLKMVHAAYNVLDKDGSGQVTIADIEMAYNVEYHPDFIAGTKTKDEILREFMSVWETHKKDGIVTVEEFEDYYKDISCSIDNDDYFELMIRNAWHIEGGEGWCEETTIKRVLKTNPDGSQEVVKVKNDLDVNIAKAAGKSYSGQVV